MVVLVEGPTRCEHQIASRHVDRVAVNERPYAVALHDETERCGGVPVWRLVNRGDLERFPEGVTVDGAAANVSRRRYEENAAKPGAARPTSALLPRRVSRRERRARRGR